ncbi:acyl carrier protein [Nannocystis sp. SCPEA4]|uniref:acyl carrier protein n=1 Tax=Nannocystis sp. SCPEA4 TaxID=2996787 RepID=UPI00226D501C|nr:acyl carrier protein [Nannocystis sp. SCPEA4]MCY1054894.1 acyl carrier protein [Nannocystis sp. SCPEA4]
MKSATEIRDWMIDYLASNLSVERNAIDPHSNLEGMQSILAASMVVALQDYLGFKLPQNIAYQYPTLDAAAQALAALSAEASK